MEDKLGNDVLFGRPYGGVAILIHKTVISKVECVCLDSRCIILKIGRLIVANVYLPSYKIADVNNIMGRDALQSTLNLLQLNLATFDDHMFLVGGDFNCDVNSEFEFIFKPLEDFRKQLELKFADNFIKGNLNYTYMHETLQHSSKIDHFLVSSEMRFPIIDYHVIDSALNYSDHLPIATVFQLLYKDLCVEKSAILTESPKAMPKYYRWDHGDRGKYYELSREFLMPIDEQLNHVVDQIAYINTNLHPEFINLEIDRVYDCIVSALQRSANSSIPRLKSGSLKFWWNQELDELKNKSIVSFRAWQDAGKPRTGPVHAEMMLHRLRYRKIIRENERNNLAIVTNDLHECLIKKDFTSFWKGWKSKLGSNKTKVFIAGLANDEQISNKFAEYFEKCCTEKTNEANIKIKKILNDRLSNYNVNGGFTSNYSISLENLEQKIKNAKLGKAAGVDELMIEHLLYAHPILICMLKKLFNIMLQVGYVPDAFGCGLIIPIPKNSNAGSNFAKIQDFRGITISPILSRIFEQCILELFHSYFVSSEYQFGFKKGRGCRDALYILSEAVNNFVSNNSNMNICAIDLTKAFDCINHDILFIKLMNIKIPCCLLKLLIVWYSKCKCVVKWGSTVSTLFTVNQGVRQGGVLSPLLFALYIDDVLCKLNNCGYGCYMAGVIISAIMYADDMVLFSPSICDLQKLITLCQTEFEQIGLKFNTSKCCVLRIGKRYKAECENLIAVDGSIIRWVSELKYLGVVLTQGVYLKINVHQHKVKFFKAFNSIFAKIGCTSSPETLVHLLESKCLSMLIYNLEAARLTNRNISDLTYPLSRAYVKIFKVKDKISILQCQFYMHQLPMDMLLDQRKIMYFNKLENSDCCLLNHVFYVKSCPERLVLLKKYNILDNKIISKGLLQNIMWSKLKENEY